MMRGIWALAVVCLLAAPGTQPGSAGSNAGGGVVRLVERHPALPAVAAARHASLVVAVRAEAAALPLAVLATPPALAPRAAQDLVAAPHRAQAPGSASIPTRSARGPPAC